MCRYKNQIFMKPIAAFFDLIRWKNILIVAVAQLLIWLCVILPFENFHESDFFFLDLKNFSLLSISTILLAAAGYIINDYFDIRIDLRNRPEKVIIGKVIKQRWAMFWHSLFNALGIGIALYLAWQLDNYGLILLQLGTTILLWLYSTHLKRMYISGNIAVAMLTALSLATVVLFEPGLYPYMAQKSVISSFGFAIINPVYFIGVYIYFAFFLTWIREIVKDMEDFKGDAEEGCVTMPIKIGLHKTQQFIYVLGVFIIVPILYSTIIIVKNALIPNNAWTWWLLSFYIIVLILLPTIYFLISIGKSTTATHYELMSKWFKWIMVFGLFTLPIYYLLHM